MTSEHDDVPTGGTNSFASGLTAWRDRLGLVRDVVRQELVHRQLVAHLPPPGAERPIRVLDVGCGQGTQVLRLARAGYLTVGLDPSDELLGLAAASLALEEDEVRERVSLHQAALEEWEVAGEGFDAVCCHGVVMYLPSLERALSRLVAAGRPGTVVSVLAKNRANLPLRAAMSQNWEEALAAFDDRIYTNRLGIHAVRADDPDEVVAALAAAGADTVAWYGVRLFTDHWGDVAPPDDIETIVRVEEEAGRRDPYRRLAAAIHVIAQRRS